MKELGKMREIVYDRRATTLTRYGVDAIAWALTRRGQHKWQSENVLQDIVRYLVDNNVDLQVEQGGHGGPQGKSPTIRYIDTENLRRTIYRLERDGYVTLGYGTASGKGHVLTSLEFKPDVILSGHSVRFRKIKQETKREYITVDEPKPVKTVYSGDPDFPDLPVPELPAPPRYMKDELDTLLDQYAELDSEAYAKWVDKVIQAVEITLDLAT